MDPTTLETHVGKATIESWLASLEPAARETFEPASESFELPASDPPPEAPFEREVSYGDLLDLRDDFAALGEQVATSDDLGQLEATLREETRRKDLELYATIRIELCQLRQEICRDFRAELAGHVDALEKRLIGWLEKRLGTTR